VGTLLGREEEITAGVTGGAQELGRAAERGQMVLSTCARTELGQRFVDSMSELAEAKRVQYVRALSCRYQFGESDGRRRGQCYAEHAMTS